MDLVFTILVITILANLALGWSTFRGQSQSISAKLFLMIIAGIVFWAVAKIIFYYASETAVNIISIPLLYISGVSIVASFLVFANTFPNEKARFRKKFYVATLLLPVVFSIAILFSDLIVGNAIILDGVRGVAFGKIYPLYVLFVAAYFILGHLILIKRFTQSSGILRAQFIYVLLGSAIASIGGVTTNVLLPWFGNFHFYWLGPPLTIIMVALFSYAIVKHHLLNVRVITTELFTALILIIMLFNALLSKSLADFSVNFVMFIVVLIFGSFLIRGTIREIHELERLSKAKSDFVSIVSHQLRTPLTAIKGFVSMIKEGSGSDKDRKDWLEKTYTTNERMIRLVNDILNISRIERGKLQYNFQQISIIKLIEGAISEIRLQAEGKGIALNWEKPAVEIPAIRADEEKLRQVILNLIDNAIRYTDKGHVNVRLTYVKDLNRIKITVQDTGIGMTKSDLENLFGQFSRGEGGQRTNVEGLGLGLYVAQSIIKAHQGKIWAESDGLHKGSRFYVELPVP